MKNIIFLLSTLTVLLIMSCTTTQNESEKRADVNVEEFKTLMTESNVVVLDVRTPKETAEGMIEGAIEIDVKAVDFKEKIKALDKDKKYLVYCRSGKRSVTACNAMEESGFEKLVNLKGGFKAWKKAK